MVDDDIGSDAKKFRNYESLEKRLNNSLQIDPRYSVLDFLHKRNFLNIVTDSVANAIRISRVYIRLLHGVSKSPSSGFKIKVVLLPDKSVGKFTKGICHVGVAPVRGSRNSSGEQVTQVLYGESFDVLQAIGDWIRIRLHADGYIGWVSSNQVSLFTEDEFYKYKSLPKVYVSEKMLPLFEKPTKKSSMLREAVLGNELAVVGNHKGFLEVKTPDGEFVYAEKSMVSIASLVKKFSLRNLLATAMDFQGISYVWGGRSVKGFDCSGFVQTVFRLNGIELPRDTNDQFSAGKPLGKVVKRLRPGDLLFFSSNGGKINHVAIYIGRNKEFIHSSGFIRINSLDPRRKNFNKRLFSRFIGACRVNFTK